LPLYDDTVLSFASGQHTAYIVVDLRVKPRTNYNEWYLLYFVSFLLLVGFFVLNMFVGVVVENFQKCREGQEQEEKARREARHLKKLERKRKSKFKAGCYYC